MDPEKNYININRASWNNRVDTHLKSEFYNLDGFMKGDTSLNSIELNLLGDVKGKSILHLQCHFGQDTISLGRLGAEATGVDLSCKAIASAEQIAKDTHSNARFICCDIYDLPKHLEQQFDIVFTSYGVIPWLPDLDKWAKIIVDFLKPNGQFVMAEFHPVVWMFDDQFEKIAYNYSNSGAIVESETGTYADKSSAIAQESVVWNHGLGEVISSLIKSGLEIKALEEFDYSPYNCFNNATEVEPKKYRIAHFGNKIPMVYAVVALKEKATDRGVPLF